jgi:hypothetical protein
MRYQLIHPSPYLATHLPLIVVGLTLLKFEVCSVHEYLFQAELRQSDRRSKLFSIKQSKAASMVPPSFSKVSSQTKHVFKAMS